MFYRLPSSLPFYPITFPGSKRQSLRHIIPRVPAEVKSLVAPFLGTGAVELCLAAMGVKIYAYDADPLLVKFWKSLLENPVELAKEIKNLAPVKNKEDFMRLTAIVMAGTGMSRETRSAAYYLINKNTSMGIGMQHLNYTLRPSEGASPETLRKIASFSAPNLRVSRSDVFTVLKLEHTRNSFLYLDPPYMGISRLYNIKYSLPSYFDHFRMAHILNNRNRWMLSYDDHPIVRELYRRHNIYEIDLKYGARVQNGTKAKEGTELLIVSRDVPVPPSEIRLF